MSKKNTKAVIFIAAEYISLLTSFSVVFKKKYNIDTVFILRDRGVQKEIKKLFPTRNEKNDLIISDIEINNIPEAEIISTAVELESKYGFTISQMLSEDRALGQGYLFNVEKVPHIIRSNWTNSISIDFKE